MNILIIDIGTSSMRGILFSKEGQMLYIHQKKHQVISLENGKVEQNPLDFLNGCIEVTGQVAKYASENNLEINGIALTSQRSSIIPVDFEGNPLCNAQMWQDKRTIPLCEELSVHNAEIFSRAGSRVNPVFSGTKMKWLKENEPEIYEKAYKILVIPDYLIYHMTGNFCTDYTYGSRSLLMNLKECKWDSYLLNLFGIDEKKLCELKAPGSIMGYTTEQFAQKTGVSSGIPVISSGGDQQCGMIGQGLSEQGQVSLTLGTGGFLLTSCEQVPDNLSWDVVCNASSDAGTYVLEANMLTCTSAMEWFKNNFYSEESDFYGKLNGIIESVPAGSDGCIAIPYFQGRSTPDWNSSAVATFHGMSLNTTREAMLKSLLEGICLEINNNIRSFEQYVPIEKIFINGGLSKSQAFNQMQAEIYGKAVLRSDNPESTAIGAWMIAARTMGGYETLRAAYTAACEGVKTESYIHHAEIHEIYKGVQDRMNRLYEQTKNM